MTMFSAATGGSHGRRCSRFSGFGVSLSLHDQVQHPAFVADRSPQPGAPAAASDHSGYLTTRRAWPILRTLRSYP